MHAAPPTRSRVLQLLWFPFFFAAAFSVMLLGAFSNPTPHDLPIGVVGSTPAAAHSAVGQLDRALEHVHAGGFDVRVVASLHDAQRQVRANSIAAAVVLPGTDAAGDADTSSSASASGSADETQILVSGGASATRAKYVEAVLTSVIEHGAITGASGSGGSTTSAAPVPAPSVADLAPVAGKDTSGVSLFFFSLPLLLVGLITSIVLLQLAAWPMRRKLVAVGAAGAFATLFTFTLATGLDAMPTAWWLLPLGFVLTQAIGWITTALPVFVKHFFMPVGMTFVLILGIPTAGATVSADMLPTPLRWLHDVLPYGAYTDAARAIAYLDGASLARPLIVLGAWVVAGAALVTLAVRRASAAQRSAARTVAAAERAAVRLATAAIVGRVESTSAASIEGAHVVAIDDAGDAQAEALTSANGRFALDVGRTGLWHVLVTAPHAEPVVATVAVHAEGDIAERTFTLVRWEDAAGNLAPDEIEARWNLSGQSSSR